MDEDQLKQLPDFCVVGFQANQAKQVIVSEGFAWIGDERSVRDIDGMHAIGFKVSPDVYLSLWNACVRLGVCTTVKRHTRVANQSADPRYLPGFLRQASAYYGTRENTTRGVPPATRSLLKEL